MVLFLKHARRSSHFSLFPRFSPLAHVRFTSLPYLGAAASLLRNVYIGLVDEVAGIYGYLCSERAESGWL